MVPSHRIARGRIMSGIRWLLGSALFLLATGSSGCYVTDWRWIWEDDDDYHCEKVQVQMPGSTMAVSVPAQR